MYRQNSLIDTIHSGDKRPFNERSLSSKNYLYRLILNKGDQYTFKIRIQSSGSLQIPLKLTPVNSYITKDVHENMFTSAVYGILLVMGLYNLFIAFVARDKNYFIYVSWVFTTLLFLISLNGDGFQVLWPNNPSVNDYILPLMFCGSGFANTLFALKFMEIEKNRPKLSMVFYILLAGYSICILIALAGNYSNSIRAVFLNNSITLFTLTLSSIYLVYKKQVNAKIFLLSYAILIVSAITLSLDTANIIPHSLFTKYANQIGIILETIIFSLALAKKIKHERNLRELKEQEAVAYSIEAKDNLKKYQELFNNSPIGIFHFNTAGTITTSNRAFLELLKLENLSNESRVQNLVFRNKDDFKKSIEDLALHQGVITLDLELPRIYPKTWVNLTILSFPTNIEGENIFEGHINDITSEKLSEIENKEHEEQKLRMLSRLVAGVAHEINTPIGTNITARSLLENEVLDIRSKIDSNDLTPDDLNAFLGNLDSISEIFSTNDQRISTLVNRFKDVSINRLNMTESLVDLPNLINETIKSFKNTSCQITINSPSTELKTYTFEKAVIEIIHQLIENSLQYSGNSKPNIEISLQDKIDRIEFTYHDDGTGINEQALEHVFDPFYTTRPGDPERTGLGLFVVYNLCHQLLGSTPTISNQNGFQFECNFAKHTKPHLQELS